MDHRNRKKPWWAGRVEAGCLAKPRESEIMNTIAQQVCWEMRGGGERTENKEWWAANQKKKEV